jgi:hypothetical protein
MDVWGILAWLERTDLSVWVREGDLGSATYLPAFYVLLFVHAVGMAMAVGISLMMTARLCGVSRAFPLSAIPTFMRVAWWGFAVNAASGGLLFIGQPRRELLTPAFDIKMALIVLAGITMAMTTRALRRGTGAAVATTDGEAVAAGARVPAAATTLLWLGAIVTGRLIAYTQPPPAFQFPA